MLERSSQLYQRLFQHRMMGVQYTAFQVRTIVWGVKLLMNQVG